MTERSSRGHRNLLMTEKVQKAKKLNLCVSSESCMWELHPKSYLRHLYRFYGFRYMRLEIWVELTHIHFVFLQLLQLLLLLFVQDASHFLKPFQNPLSLSLYKFLWGSEEKQAVSLSWALGAKTRNIFFRHLGGKRKRAIPGKTIFPTIFPRAPPRVIHSSLFSQGPPGDTMCYLAEVWIVDTCPGQSCHSVYETPPPITTKQGLWDLTHWVFRKYQSLKLDDGSGSWDSWIIFTLLPSRCFPPKWLLSLGTCLLCSPQPLIGKKLSED